MSCPNVTQNLSAFVNDELSQAESRLVAEHLMQCLACRERYDEIKLGSQLAEELPMMKAPDGMWAEIERALDGKKAKPANVSGWTLMRVLRFACVALSPVLVVIAIVMIGVGHLKQKFEGPVVQVRVEQRALSDFERFGRELHQTLGSGTLKLDFLTSAPGEIRRWVSDHTRLHAWVALDRPVEDGDFYKPVGVKKVLFKGAEAICVVYRVGTHPVTLLAMNQQALPELPKERPHVVDVATQTDPESGLKVMSWAKDGQAYVVVSDLPESGQQGCFLCHAQPERREQIRSGFQQGRNSR
ncbi:MAG TPA: zf-HC2 domain-containing protein [Acidobacteriota bacterium]|nr:zf-HC2 domain-containing protein [Acidobacteriota bacterium]HND18919.1 zf-HC2 domain-containing protein [Acidobacteriota bacterium]HNG96343.1 zf-HC2 domain-containing protein [Acidobacteriota bacterium]HNJ44432.1 zf-HC2 domain-containing protein [Acidobacteriota bacterium]